MRCFDLQIAKREGDRFFLPLRHFELSDYVKLSQLKTCSAVNSKLCALAIAYKVTQIAPDVETLQCNVS
ncbi:MAG: hypothetical protein RMX96_29525 [Nostoc sp. ChiSLP02]|nr:hypothetical protein [Nostoc sp. DedSLP05]MDZ8101055.1 hypothetical protein [Nostoc sp. DedSLP01]MDZ8188981.1 hypothetical protein [Nostoc sp. ChiSLP02]